MQEVAEAAKPAARDPITQAFAGDSMLVKLVLVMLLLAALAAFSIWALKLLQLSRLRRSLHTFERAADGAADATELLNLSLQHRSSPGGRVVMALGKHHQKGGVTSDMLSSIAKRAVVSEQQKASSLMPVLASIASASPFIGLFGTVWGIMIAFNDISREKNASIDVVAGPIGEALIATAVGLVAAIPATIAYNFVDRKLGDLIDELEASVETWVVVLTASMGLAPPRAGEQALPPNVKR